MATQTLEEFQQAHSPLVDWLYARSEAGRWQLPRTQFAEALHRSVCHRFRDGSLQTSEITSFLNSLHVADLALACACARGNEPAWEYFFRHYRADLYSAARAIVGSSGRDGVHEARARDLADSLYAELYGLADSAASRRSLFRYFRGRSKLSTWLRAVLAQRHVDSLRASRRWEPLEEESETADRQGLYSPHRKIEPDPDRSRYLSLLQDSLLSALASLAPRDRLRLAYYYVQDLTLAQIGRLLGEHEATVSRHLDRVRRELRRQVESNLRDVHRLSQAQIELCFEYALDDWPHDLSRALSESLPERAQE
jgi:RNA polymerase sigma-70 factor (ECF subfamily)